MRYVYLRFGAAAAAKSLQSCPTLCDPIDGLLPGSSVPGIDLVKLLPKIFMTVFHYTSSI